MAEDEEKIEEIEDEEEGEKKKKPKRSGKWRSNLMWSMTMLVTIVFWRYAIFLIIAMAPTIITLFIDRSRGRYLTFTVGAMNFATCFPFLLTIYQQHDVSGTAAIDQLVQPLTIVIIYMGAAIGHMINWAVTGIVSSILVQRDQGQLKKIKLQLKDMRTRWGEEVTGEIKVDKDGFPLKGGAPHLSVDEAATHNKNIN